MKQVIVRYRVRPERAAENEELVRAVVAEMHETKPAPLTSVEAFKRFQENIADRCDQAPVVSSLTEIGSYAILGD
jgi:hypothetical protein